MHAVETVELTKYYGRNRGIEGVNLIVREGEIFGFIGPNGAGKTTTIRILLSLIRPTTGRVKIFGRAVPVGGGKLYRRVGYVPAEVQYYPEMTGWNLIDYAGDFYSTVNRAWVEELVERLQFDPVRKIRTYSHGNRKKLGIIQALLHKPRLVVLDEPTGGLDPLVRLEFFKLLEEMNKSGVTIFFSTHVLEEVERVCHAVAMIKEGRLVYSGPAGRLPGRDTRVLILRFSGRQPSAAALSLLGEAVELEGQPGCYRVLSRLPANELIGLLSRFNLEHVKIAEADLEEIFMGFYEPSAREGGRND